MGKIKLDGSAVQTTEASINAVILRCGCGDPDSHNGLLCNCKGKGCDFCARPCPKLLRVEDLGTVSYYHRNPWFRFVYWFRRYILRRKETVWRTK